MAGDTSQSDAPRFPEALEACLREDAIVRADARLLLRQQEEIQATATQAREASALPGRLRAAFGRSNSRPPTPEQAAEIFARENAARRLRQESELITQHYTRELDTRIHGYLLTQVPAYARQSRARLRLVEWAETIAGLQAGLRELIKALGQARNNAVTGYNPVTHSVSPIALKLFDQAGIFITKVENRVAQANAVASRLGDLPGVTIMPLREIVHNLTKLDMAPMQLEADRLVRELEHFEQKQLADLQRAPGQEAEAAMAQARAYLAQYREQLRAHYDGVVTPDEVRAAIPGIIDRFRRGLD